MGFFSDLKEDLSQAVSELMPDEKTEDTGAESQMQADMADRLDAAEVTDMELSDPAEAKSEEDKLLAELLSGGESSAEAAVRMEDFGGDSKEAPLTGTEEDLAALFGEQASFAEMEDTDYTAASKESAETETNEDRLLAELFSGADGNSEEISGAEQEIPIAEIPEAEPEILTTEVPEQEKGMMQAAAAEEVQEELPVEDASEKALSETETPAEAEMIITAEADNMSEKINTSEEGMEMDNAMNEEVNETEKEGVKKMEEQVFGENEVASDEKSVITEAMTITGDIISRGSMEVLGTITGNIDILGKLDVTGVVNGNSKAAEIYAESAKIMGEVNSLGSVKVGQSSVIIGNIMATSAVIAGAVKGDIDVKGPVILDTSAIVMGNIKSKSVQINNGAVVEGMCSQCYADVNPTAFFDEFKKTAKI